MKKNRNKKNILLSPQDRIGRPLIVMRKCADQVEHAKYCNRYFVDINEDICDKCKHDPLFRQELVENRINVLEQRLAKWTPCPHAKSERTIEKKCCGGKTSKVEIVECGLYNGTVEKTRCVTCERKYIISVTMSQHGIGDIICGMYVIAGAQKANPEAIIRYYTHKPDWAGLMDGIEALDIKKMCGVNNVKNFCYDYKGELRAKAVRKDWYSKVLNVKPAVPKLRNIKGIETPIHAQKPYVVIAPFAAWQQREWPLTHYMHLEVKLQKAGYKTVIIGDAGQQRKLRKNFSGACFWGQSPQAVCNLILHSQCVIGNNSGIAHLGGLLGVPTVAVHAQLGSETTFSLTNVVSVMPSNAHCSPCHFQMPHFIAACDRGCWALMGISPDRVFDTVMQTITIKKGAVA